MNDQAGSADFVSITGVAEVYRDANKKTFSMNLTLQDTKIFLRVGSKQRKAL